MSYRLMAARASAGVLRPPAWLRTVRASPAVAALRADAARTVLDVAAALALTARADSTAAPTWPALVEASERSRATVARVLAWLRTQKLLVTLENGSTEQFRPTPRARRDRPAPVAVEGNRAAVYLLTEALPEELPEPCPTEGTSGPPTSADVRPLRDETPPHHPSGAVEDQPRTSARANPGSSPPSSVARKSAQRPGGWPAVARPGSQVGYRQGGADGTRGSRGQQRSEDLAAAKQLRARALDLRPLSPAAVRAVVRPFLAAGWSVEDLLWGIDHAPDGTRRTYAAGSPTTTRAAAGADLPAEVVSERRRRGVLVDDGAAAARAVASPAAWLRWRLAPWAGLAGPVAASRAAAAERSTAARAAAAQRREVAAAAAAAATPPPVAYLQARRALQASRGLRQGPPATGDEPAVANPRNPAGPGEPSGSTGGPSSFSRFRG